LPRGGAPQEDDKTHSDLERLRRFLKEGNFPEDGRLPPERELAITLNLTRSKLRTVLAKLEKAGEVWRHVGIGTFIGTRPPSAPQNGNARIADMTNPREVIEARMVLEPQLARLAATRATPRLLEELERQLQRLEATSDPEVFQALDRKWHQLLADATHNRLLASFLASAHGQTDPNVWGRLRSIYMTSDRMREAVQEHRAVLNAVKTRDPDQAADRMRAHIRAVRSAIFGDFD